MSGNVVRACQMAALRCQHDPSHSALYCGVSATQGDVTSASPTSAFGFFEKDATAARRPALGNTAGATLDSFKTVVDLDR